MRKTSGKFFALALGFLSAIMLSTTSLPYSMAETQASDAAKESQLENVLVPLDATTSIEKTILNINIPHDNALPWAFVDGVIENPIQGHPVIIQFFEENNYDDPIHVAQVEVQDDNSYEYKFRVRDVNLETGKVKNIFEGNYQVKIFKVVETNPDLDKI